MANQDYQTAEKNYESFIGILKTSTIITAVVAIIVVLLIS